MRVDASCARAKQRFEMDQRAAVVFERICESTIKVSHVVGLNVTEESIYDRRNRSVIGKGARACVLSKGGRTTRYAARFLLLGAEPGMLRLGDRRFCGDTRAVALRL